MGSTRLPGKVLADVVGKPLLFRMIERLKRCETLDDVVVAYPTGDDDALHDVVRAAGARPFCGPEEDVLARVLLAARGWDADVIVELTGDCPLIDPVLVNLTVERYLYMRKVLRMDMLSTTRDSLKDPAQPYLPRGMDIRVFPRDVLEDLDKLTVGDPVSREHVSLYAWEHPRRFWVVNLPVEEEDGLCSDVRLTVDTPEDLELVREIFETLYPMNPGFGLREILALLAFRPELRKINRLVKQKEVR